MITHLFNIIPDDVGGLDSGRPWLLLNGSESWQAVFARLRDDPPKGVIFAAGSNSLTAYLQAWARAAKPLITVVLPGAELLRGVS
jgi:hypothetical protein